MAITGFTSSDNGTDYDFLMKKYKKEGMNMIFNDFRLSKSIKLGELKHSEIKYYIKYLDKPDTYSEKAWYKILNDTIIKQRQLKIEKIRNETFSI